jgi:hypothetical protein
MWRIGGRIVRIELYYTVLAHTNENFLLFYLDGYRWKLGPLELGCLGQVQEELAKI